MISFNRRWKLLLKLVGPVFFVFLIIRVVDLKTTASLIKDIRPAIALLSILVSPVVIAASTLRWWFTCRRLQMDTAFKDLFQICYLSWFFGLIPLVVVSPLSKFIYLKDEGKPASATAISITLDKLFDIIGLMVFGIFGLMYFPKGFFNQTYLWFILASIILFGFALLLFGSRIWFVLKEIIKRHTHKRLQRIGRDLNTDLTQFWSGFNVKFFLLILGISIIIELLRSFILYILAVSMNMQVSFGLIVACRSLIGIVNVFPITVNGIGTRDAVLLLTLSLAGVSKEAAIALSCLMLLWIICSRLSGIFFWLKRPLPSGSIRKINKA